MLLVPPVGWILNSREDREKTVWVAEGETHSYNLQYGEHYVTTEQVLGDKNEINSGTFIRDQQLNRGKTLRNTFREILF